MAIPDRRVAPSSSPTPCWFTSGDALPVLWQPKGGLAHLRVWWPLDAANKGSAPSKVAARCNAATRLILAGTTAVFLLGGLDMRAIVVGAIALALVVIVTYRTNRQRDAARETAQGGTGGAGASGGTGTITPQLIASAPDIQEKTTRTDPWEFVPTRADPTPNLLPSGAVAPDRDENPYQNPMPYAAPGVEVRSERATYEPEPEPWLDKLYRGSEDTPMDWYANRLPDPTLMARPVFWNYDDRPDIVSAQARVADRWMTY